MINGIEYITLGLQTRMFYYRIYRILFEKHVIMTNCSFLINSTFNALQAEYIKIKSQKVIINNY